MNILYYDCFSGISGDMNLGAMIDLGIEKDWLVNELDKLKLHGWELKAERDQRHGIFGTRVTVRETEKHHVHRHLADIRKIIASSDLDDKVKETAMRIFMSIAEAEATVHQKDIEEVHFHEVGAIDSIIDITGAAICFHKLNIDRVVVSVVELGSGFVKCEHGILPVPAPATALILKDIPVSTGGVAFEATTPTGAAIVASLGDTFGTRTVMQIKKTGYGIGQKENPDKPNLLRVHLADYMEEKSGFSEALLLESNIDDMNPELYDNLIEKLLEAGASDVFLTPVIMKKSRPGTKISIICYPGRREKLTSILFSESTTLGIRCFPFEKHTLEREFRQVETPFGKVTVKLSLLKGKITTAKAEISECVEISNRESLPLKEVCRIINKSIDETVFS